jgi:hypothetical protein
MNAAKVMEKLNIQRQEGEKGELLKGLTALLLATPISRNKARNYIERAISYIEQN